MPNFFSAFTSEVFRPLVTLLIPGAIATSTWFVALLWRFSDLRALVYRNHTETALILFLAITFAGLVLEDLGAHVETEFDWIRDRDNRHIDNWYAYLRTAFKADPIGRRYVRTLVLRLKFELGVAFGMLSTAGGILWLWHIGLGGRTVAVAEFLCGLFTFYGFYEGWSTHNTLAINRENLLRNIRVIPPGQADGMRDAENFEWPPETWGQTGRSPVSSSRYGNLKHKVEIICRAARIISGIYRRWLGCRLSLSWMCLIMLRSGGMLDVRFSHRMRIGSCIWFEL